MKTIRKSRMKLVYTIPTLCLGIFILKNICSRNSIVSNSNCSLVAYQSNNILKHHLNTVKGKLLTVDLDIWSSFFGPSLCRDQDEHLHIYRTSFNDYWFQYIEIIKQDNFVIISNANYGYLEFALNFWQHYQKLGYENIVFIAEDCAAYSFLENAVGKQHVAPPLLQGTSNEAQIYGSKGFGKIASMRPIYMHYFLNRGVSVVWQDLDSVPLQDPMKFIPRGFDAVLVDDQSTDFHYSSNYLCSCFIYMNPSSGTLSTLKLWLEELKVGEDVNQLAFNRAISAARVAQKMTVAILPRTVFPNGVDFDRFKNTAVWIHANYKKGSKRKKDFLIERNAWLSNRTSYSMS